jgi:hypothetical protein
MNRFRPAWTLRLWAFVFSVIGTAQAQVTTWHQYLVVPATSGSSGSPGPVLGTPFSPPTASPPAWVGALSSIPPNFGSPLASASDSVGNVYTIYSNNPLPSPAAFQGFISRTTSGVTTYFGLSFAPLALAVNPGGDVFIMNFSSFTYTVYQLKPDGSTLLVGSFSSSGTNAGTLSVDSSGNPQAPVSIFLGGASNTLATYLFAAETPVPDLAAPLAPVSVPFSANPAITLNGTAFSSLPITYQWSYNGTPIPGATAATYTGTVTASGTYTVLATTTAGSVTSQAIVTLVVDSVPISPAPIFLTNPASVNLPLGPSTTLTATAASTLPISFQWYVNGAAIPGATQVSPSSTDLGSASTSYTTNQPGSYLAVATTSGTGGASIMSLAAVVTIQAPGGISVLPTPTITTQPQSTAFAYGKGATLTANSIATLPATYQWQLNGVNIPGANSATYQTNLLGSYDVVITTSAGSVTSAAANVALANRPVNISSRSFVGTGANLTIAGFVISSYSGATKRVLVRAAGPGLAPLGVPGALAQPVLSVYDSNSQLVATNTGWNNSAAIAAASTATGAFPFAANSADSALILDLAPGNYTAQVSGVNGTTGIALVEVYELAPDNGHFINISTRAFVGSDAAILIGGLVVTGTQPSPVLIRAIGPGLARFGLSGFLTQPILSIYNNSTGQLMAVNIGWSNGSSADATGGFALTTGSADSAVLLTLAPGVYTAQVTGANGTTGIALVEAYEVPQP